MYFKKKDKTDYPISREEIYEKLELEYNKDLYDPRKIIKSGESAIKKVVHEKNKILGCINKIY